MLSHVVFLTHLYNYRACPTCYCTQRWMTYFTRSERGHDGVYSNATESWKFLWRHVTKKSVLRWNFHVIEMNDFCCFSIPLPLLFVLFVRPLEKRLLVSTALTQTEQPLYNVSSFLNLFPITVATKIAHTNKPKPFWGGDLTGN